MQRTKRGNPHRLPKQRRPRQYAPSSFRQPRAPLTVAQPVEPLERTQLTLHDSDPITGNEDTFSTLFYECYQGYTIYSTPDGSCCMHGKQGYIKLQSKFVCFAYVEEAKALIKRFRAEGYTSYDSMEQYLPEWVYVCLNRHEQQRTPGVSCPTQSVP